MLTIVEADGVRHHASDSVKKPDPFGVEAAEGDDETPNNSCSLQDTNAFVCTPRVTMGASDGKPNSVGTQQKSVVPERIDLTAIATADEQLIFSVTVEVKNSLGQTAAVVLDVPRLPGLLLLEEEHTCGEVRYEPKVHEKEAAEAAYKATANSSTQSATLSATEDHSIAVKLDKVPAGATARFGCKFIVSGGLRAFAAVQASGDADAERLADIAVLAPFTPLDAAGVPFTFTLVFADCYALQALPYYKR